MNEITDKSIMAALGRQLSMAVAQQAVAASNLANLDTPGYRTREVSFDQVLDEQLREAGSLAATDPGHLAGRPPAAAASVREAEGLPIRRDGNNVELDRELLRMSRAAADFTAAQTALAAKFRLVRYAINEGR
jgi:flagellar basal-body rod protein FlgB